MKKEKKNPIWKELKKHKIHSEKELDNEISKMTLLNISCFVNKEVDTIYEKTT